MVHKVANALVLGIALSTQMLAAEEGKVNLFAGDIGNAVWTLVIFVCVILVLGKFAWGPLLAGLQRREQFIRESLEEAKREREQAEALREEYTTKLDAASAEVIKIVEEGQRDAESIKNRIEEKAREETDNMVARAKREIDLAKQTAIKELYSSSITLGTEIASRIIQKEMTAKDHDRLISESIESLGEIETH